MVDNINQKQAIEDQNEEDEENKFADNPKRQTKFEQLRGELDNETYKKWDNEQKYIRSMIKEYDNFNWQIIDKKAPNFLQYIGGFDISINKNVDGVACSYFVVMQYPDFKVLYEDFEYIKEDSQYIPGFLAFREAAHLVKLFNKFQQIKPEFRPQVILVDGNGILHPNACGLASHLGVLLNVPTIGCGKKVFYIDGLTKDIVYDQFRNNTKNAGDYVKLIGKSGRVWGAALKSTKKCEDPMIISIGQNISLETAVVIVAKCCKFKVPEPVRYADIQSREKIKKMTYEQVLNAVHNTLTFLTDQLPEEQQQNKQQQQQINETTNAKSINDEDSKQDI